MDKDHIKGLVLTIVGVLVLTPDTLLIRLAAVDQWTLVFWRGSLMATVMLGYIVWQEGRGTAAAFVGIGRNGIIVGISYSLSFISFVAAVSYTGIANTLIILASAPMFAAILGRFVLSETVPIRTILAIIVTFIGIFVVVTGDADAGENNLIGDLIALVTAAVMASAFVFVRRAKTTNMMPATAIAGALAAVAAITFGSASPFDLNQGQAIWVFLMGAVVLPISFGLLTLGPRYIPAPEVGLILLLETALGPLWVWLVLGEGANAQVLTGGAIVVTALTLHSIRGLQLNLAKRGS